MATATLRRSGGSLIMTIPSAYAEQNHLNAGDSVEVTIEGERMTIEPQKRRPCQRYGVEALIAETPEELFHNPEWEDMPPVGKEIW
jgi:antitoxin component of MazEF toxin-antitoxin module